MDQHKLEKLLTEVQAGQINIQDALARLQHLPYDNLGFARLDSHRSLRQGLPEVVFCETKTIDQVKTILRHLWQQNDQVLGTRVSAEMAAAVQDEIPEAHYDTTSRLLSISRRKARPHSADAPYALVLSAGTSDQPVAEEAAQTLEFFGNCTRRAYDVGVAGIHRLFDQADLLRQAEVIISVAGMEGALTSVVAGLVASPVIGVPTSIGYGASFNGLAPLLAMLNSCSAGVAVVNIDNGFGAAVFAHSILQRIK